MRTLDDGGSSSAMGRLVRAMLGVAHVAVAVTLLPAAMFFGVFTIPFVVPGLIWLAILGFRIWRPDRSLRRALRVTHSVLAPLSVLLVAYGWFCLEAAKRSAQAGGGLLGAFGLIPIMMGLASGGLSVATLWATRSARFIETRGSERTAGAPEV